MPNLRLSALLPRSIVVVAGRTDPTENKRLFHSYDVPDGKSTKTDHQPNKIREGHPITDTQYPTNGSLDKPRGRHTNQYPERGLYCGLGFFSHSTHSLLAAITSNPGPSK
jgi:hypothetical protein